MSKSYVDKIKEAINIIDINKTVEVDFGGILSGVNEFDIEFIHKEKLYDITLNKIDCKKDIHELSKLIVVKIKNEINNLTI